MCLDFKIGLKLFTTNVPLISAALKIQRDFFDFIELNIIPGSYEKTIRLWQDFDVPYVIHAPHTFHGMNLAQEEKRESNRLRFSETCKFADELHSDMIIVHGGNNGTFEETLQQIADIADRRIILENKPRIGIMDEICIGWSPQEFKEGLQAGILNGMVLDFVHATSAAYSSGIHPMEMIKAFMDLCPKLFHLSDGDSFSEKDIHLNLGKGNLDIAGLLTTIPIGRMVTIETPRNVHKGLEEFISDVYYLRTLLSKRKPLTDIHTTGAK
jgi:sugar phosphate isomerase/epimerase